MKPERTKEKQQLEQMKKKCQILYILFSQTRQSGAEGTLNVEKTKENRQCPLIIEITGSIV